MDVETRATGEATGWRGYRRRVQVTEASTMTQDRAQAEGPSGREMGMASRTGEEASLTERARDTEPERDVYRGGAGPSSVTSGDGGARLTVAEGVALCEMCAGKATK